MTQKWNLQDIRPAEPRRKRRVQNANSVQPNNIVGDDASEPVKVIDGNRRKTRTSLTIALTIIFIVSGTAIISYLMQGVQLEVEPLTQQPNLNATITAFPEPRPNELSYELLQITSEAERQVAASGEVEEESFASGTITIINENPNRQQLVENTRFESPDGLIYRISESVTIPAASTDGDELQPGTLQVTVTADSTGDQYNISDTVKFTIPGFAESGSDHLFETVYAENQTSLSGGFSGARLQIQDEDRQIARQELQVQLRDELRAQVDAERPADFIYYQNAITFTFEALPAIEYGEDMATLIERATIHVPLFNRSELAAFIATATVPGYQNEPIRLENADELNFSYQDISSNVDLTEMDSLTFTVTGRPLLVWDFDQNELRQQMLQERKDSLPLILAEFPAIERGEVRMQPFWQRTFPSNPELIEIREVIN